MKTFSRSQWQSFLSFIENETSLFEISFLGYPWYQNAIDHLRNSQGLFYASSASSPMVAEAREKDFRKKISLLNEQYDHFFIVKAKQRRRDENQYENYLFHDIFSYLRKHGQRFIVFEVAENSDVYDLKYLRSQFADMIIPFEYLLNTVDSVVGYDVIKKRNEEYHTIITEMFASYHCQSSLHKEYALLLRQAYMRLAGSVPRILLMQQLLSLLRVKALWGGMGTHFDSGLNNAWSVVEVEHGFGVPSYIPSKHVRQFYESHFNLLNFFVLQTRPGKTRPQCLEQNLFSYGMPDLRQTRVTDELRLNLIEKYQIQNKRAILIATSRGRMLNELRELVHRIKHVFTDSVILIRQHPSYDALLSLPEQNNVFFVNDENLFALLSLTDIVITSPGSIVAESSVFTQKIIVYSDDDSDEMLWKKEYPWVKFIDLHEEMLIEETIRTLFLEQTQKMIYPPEDITHELDRLLLHIRNSETTRAIEINLPQVKPTDNMIRREARRMRPPVPTHSTDNFLPPAPVKENMDLYVVRASILKALKLFLPQCRGVFLDVGCGEMPYKDLILKHVDRYIGLDIENPLYQKSVKPDIFWDGRHIPLDDDSVDCSMATELFEHLPDIEAVLKEICRVLRPGGTLFFTVPFLWPLHDMPHDEYRYTPVSLHRHLDHAGFGDIQIHAMGGWDMSLAQMIGLWVRRRPMPADRRTKFTDMLFPLYQQLVQSDEKMPGFSSQTMITGLSGTAVKSFQPDRCKPLSLECDTQRQIRSYDASSPEDRINQSIRAGSIEAKPLRVVIVQSGFPIVSATFILDQMTGLIDQGFQIENWATYNPGQPVVHENITRYRLSDTTKYLQLPPESLRTQPAGWVQEFARLNGIQNWDGIGIFHIHYGLNFNLLQPIFQYFPHKPVLVSFHGHDASRYIQQHGKRCYDYLFDRVDLITTPSAVMKNNLVALGCPPDKIRIHRYGIDLEQFNRGTGKTPGSPLTLLTVARLVEKKGIGYSLQAFARLPDRSRVRYRIVGEGPLGDELQELARRLGIEKEVTFLGACSKKEVVREMSRADVFVLTSVTAADGDQEGLPVALIEAQAMGLPAISSHHAGIPELIQHGTTGFLAAEKDVAAITGFMTRLISDHSLRAALSSNARQGVEREFNIRMLNNTLADYLLTASQVRKSPVPAPTIAVSRNELKCRLEEKGWAAKFPLYSSTFEGVEFIKSVDSPAASVIVISWRAHPDTLKNFQILEKERSCRFELIFVDNGATAGHFDHLRPFVDTYIKLTHNTGAYLARNIGAVFAAAPHLIFLEDDGIPEAGFVQAHLNAHDKYDVLAVRGVYKPKSNNPLNTLARHYYLGDHPCPSFIDLEGNASFDARAFFSVGGWDDEILFGHGGIDLSIRLLAFDRDIRKLIYHPAPVIRHDYAHSREHLESKLKKQHASHQRLLTKHPQWDSIVAGWTKLRGREELVLLRSENNPAVYGKHGQSLRTATVQGEEGAAISIPREQTNIPPAQELINLYVMGWHDVLVRLAEQAPDHELLASMASAIHFAGNNPRLAVKAAAFISDPQQRRLREETARMWTSLHAPLDAEPRVHLLVLCYNREEYVEAALRQLAGTEYRNYALYLADNGSSDRTWEMVERAVSYFPAHVQVHMERLPTNIGRPAGHNWLLTKYDHSEADYIAIGDDDLVEVPSDWLTRMIQTARAFPRCAVVGGKALNPGKPDVIHGGIRNILTFTSTELRLSNSEDAYDYGQFDYVDKVDHVIGCLHIYDRKKLDQTGLFDIRFSPCQFVDIDHHLRIRMAGYDIIFNGLIAFRHLRAMGAQARGDAALAGNSDGNAIKILRKYNPETVAQVLARLQKERNTWLGLS